jgi:drug/metabolite transporter (DMT)-like permease
MRRHGEAYGLAVTALGVVVISPDSLLIRLAAHVGSDTTLFWRNLFVAMTLFALIAIGGRGRILPSLRALGPWGWVSVGLLTITDLGFVLAVNGTSVANVLIIMATMPLFAALLAWGWLGERIRPRTWAAILIAMLGMAVTVSGSLGGGEGSPVGDAIALIVTAAHGANLVVLRRAGAAPILPALAMSALIAAFLVLPFADPLAVDAAGLGWLALSGLVQMPLGFLLFFSGTRWAAAAAVALTALLETVLGPVWVWAALGEVPDRLALIGGLLVLGAISANVLLAIREGRRPLPPG